jgi:gas vesicle protein
MTDRDEGFIDIAVAFTLGALLGAGLALFFAPDSGEKTRKELGKKGRKLKKRAQKELRAAGEEWAGDAEERIQEWTEQITDAVTSGVETIRDAVSEELKGLEKKLVGKKGLFG